MRPWRPWLSLALALMLGAGVAVAAPRRARAVAATPVAAVPPAPSTLPGWPLYDRYCLACHGAAGDGRGPGAPWLWPPPRDFTSGVYKWRSTPIGSAPTDDDLRAAVRFGARGTSMPGFEGALSDAQRDQVIQVVKAFAPMTFPSVGLAPPAAAAPLRSPAASQPGQGAWTNFGCVTCHGEGGRGDGPAATSLRDAAGRPAAPYDLTTRPLRRPHQDVGHTTVWAIRDSIATGIAGTPMPGYAGQISEENLMLLAAHVDSLRHRGAVDVRAATATAAAAIEADRTGGVTAGIWPGGGTPEETIVFGQTIALQGPPPSSLAPAQAQLSARQCGRCHAKQVREWQTSLHAAAASPGLIAQIARTGEKGRMSASNVESCQRCHGPLAEQLAMVRPAHQGGDTLDRTYRDNPAYDEALRDEGVTCAGCHVRGWTRHGPPVRAPSLLSSPSYPLETLALYERADLCLSCHQLPPRAAVAGRPLLNTYREWLEGPYQRRGIQCQHCHMPNREHTFRGVHDLETFRQGIAVDARAVRTKGGVIGIRAGVRNVGAGHYLPTTPTPAAWLRVELQDARGRTIAGATAERRIGRKIEYVAGAWHELEDTRIPPGERLELATAWRGAQLTEATQLEVTVEVSPDDYYEGLYQRRLAATLAPDIRANFEEALTRARNSHYVAYRAVVPIGTPAAATPPGP